MRKFDLFAVSGGGYDGGKLDTIRGQALTRSRHAMIMARTMRTELGAVLLKADSSLQHSQEHTAFVPLYIHSDLPRKHWEEC